MCNTVGNVTHTVSSWPRGPSSTASSAVQLESRFNNLFNSSLWTPALVNHHFGQVPFDYVRVHTEVYQAHAGELEGRAARLHAAEVVRLPDLLDHVGVVGDEGVGRPVVAAVSSAVIRVVALRRYDPVVPAERLEADVEALLAALVAGVGAAVQRPSPHPLRRRRLRVDDEEGPVGVALPFAVTVEDMDVPVATARTVDEQPEFLFGVRLELLFGIAFQPTPHRRRQVDLLPAGVLLVQRRRHWIIC